jgi:hypothetical protein
MKTADGTALKVLVVGIEGIEGPTREIDAFLSLTRNPAPFGALHVMFGEPEFCDNVGIGVCKPATLCERAQEI